MEMMKNSPKDCYATVQKTVVVILERLQHVLQMESHVQNRCVTNQLHKLQNYLDDIKGKRRTTKHSVVIRIAVLS